MNDYNQILKDGYRFNMGEYISDGWKLFSKGAGSFIGFFILSFIGIMILSFIPFVNFISNFIQILLYAGMYVFCRQLTKGHEEFGDFFKGFNYAGPLILHNIVLFLFFAPLMFLLFGFIIPFELFAEMLGAGPFDQQEIGQEIGFQMAQNMAASWWVFLLVIFASFYLGLSYLFVVPLIVDGKLGFWEAMELSRKVVGKKFFNYVIMMIAIGILLGLGVVFTCGLGVLVAGPLFYCIMFSAYDKIFTPYLHSVEDEIDEFGGGQNDSNTEREYEN